MEIRVGDWVVLDDEDKVNRIYHEGFQERYSLEFNKKYLVVGLKYRLVSLKVGKHPHHYTCFTRSVRLVESPNEKVVLWK